MIPNSDSSAETSSTCLSTDLFFGDDTAKERESVTRSQPEATPGPRVDSSASKRAKCAVRLHNLLSAVARSWQLCVSANLNGDTPAQVTVSCLQTNVRSPIKARLHSQGERVPTQKRPGSPHSRYRTEDGNELPKKAGLITSSRAGSARCDTTELTESQQEVQWPTTSCSDNGVLRNHERLVRVGPSARGTSPRLIRTRCRRTRGDDKIDAEATTGKATLADGQPGPPGTTQR